MKINVNKASKKNRNKHDLSYYLSVIYLLIIFSWVIVPSLWQTTDPTSTNINNVLQAPNFEHIAGTDETGRDVFSRIIHGAQVTISIALISSLLSASIGLIIGSIMAMMPKKLDSLMMRFVDVLMVFPDFIIALLIIAVLGVSENSVITAITISMLPAFIRLARASALGVINSGYVFAAKQLGINYANIWFRHVLSPVLQAVVSLGTLAIASALVSVSALSFIGLGVQEPNAEWGLMLSAAQNNLAKAWWLWLYPGVILVFTVLSINKIHQGYAKSKWIAYEPAKTPIHLDTEHLDIKPHNNEALLSIRNLNVTAGSADKAKKLLIDVDLDIMPQEIVALIAPSGSGKTVLSKTIVGLNSDTIYSSATAFVLDKKNLAGASQNTWGRMRGISLAVMSQDAMQSLDPLQRISGHLTEPQMLIEKSTYANNSLLHLQANSADVVKLTRKQRLKKWRAKAYDILSVANLSKKYFSSFPFELSGGQQQRALFAQAAVTSPKLIIVDEPNSALDPMATLVLLDALKEYRKNGGSILLISHDHLLVRALADRAYQITDKKFLPYDLNNLANVQELAQKPNKVEKNSDKDIITSVRDLQLRNSQGDFRLNNINFDVYRNEFFVIIGPSGGGKTTLAKSITAQIPVDSGQVQHFLYKSTYQKAHQVYMIDQNSYGAFNPKHTVSRALSEAMNSNKENSYSEQQLLDLVFLSRDLLNQKCITLSGGQLQRLNIARAVAAGVQILICDEITSGLDPENTEKILELLHKISRQNTSVIIISHNIPAVLPYADRMAMVVDGQIKQLSAGEEFITKPNNGYIKDFINAAGI